MKNKNGKINPAGRRVGWEINEKILESFRQFVDQHADEYGRVLTYTEACEIALLNYIEDYSEEKSNETV